MHEACQVTAGRVKSRRCSVGRGLALLRLPSTRLGATGPDTPRRGEAGYDETRLGLAPLYSAGPVTAGHGTAAFGTAPLFRSRQGQSRFGRTRLVPAWPGNAPLGLARLTYSGPTA